MSTPTIIKDGTGTKNAAQVTSDNALKVTIANQPVEITGVGSPGIPDNGVVTVQGSDNQITTPLFVTESSGPVKKFAILQLINAPQSAIVDNTSVGPYTVGGTTLTVTVNTIPESYSFLARAATAGQSISDSNPAISNGTKTTLNVSVDGGGAKNVNITANLTTGTSIAAAIQAAIRANIPGAGAVTCDYGVTNPGKYTVTSGTTGTTSKIVIKNGGATDVTTLLKLGVANGGTEFIGTIVNSYRQFEVINALSTAFPDLTIFQSPSGFIRLQTLSTGATSNIQVTAGGANTALLFPTTLISGTNGTGSSNLGVDGSSIPQIFIIPTISKSFLCSKITFNIRSAAPTANKFGNIAQLTNGVLFQIVQNGQIFNAELIFRTGGEMIQLSDSGSIVTPIFSSDNTGLTTANFIFSTPIYFSPNNFDGVYVTISDNLSTLVSFNVYVYGIT